MFCNSCQVCQQSKDLTQLPTRLLHTLPIPTRLWQSIGMDFIGPFPKAEQYNYLWVVICQMTSMVHLIPVNTKMTAKELSVIFLKEVVRLHGLSESIVSDRDSKFTSIWWKEISPNPGSKIAHVYFLPSANRWSD
jgi:hypothetical protein